MLSRILQTCLCLLLAVTCGAAEVRLTTPQGTLVGATAPDSDKVRVFKGIPYGAPPVGPGRWHHATPAAGWQGERLATEFSPVCLQHPYAPGTFFARPSRISSEDCLYLNVWTAADSNEKLPVMFWIHGGGLTRGTGATEAYDGTALANKGVVVVTINYRLDLFGYFNHPDLKDEAGNPLANFGTTDQVLALKWVRDNISAFGGDPGNVTIFGESAGAFSVHHLMATPLAAGLFHRAIGQSGSALGPMDNLRDKTSPAHAMALKLQSQAGATNLHDLMHIDGARLLSLAEGTRFRPAVDGMVFEQEIRRQFAQGTFNAVPLMVGFNAHEGTTLGVTYRIPASAEEYIARVRKQYGDLADQFLQIYPATDLRKSTLDAFRDGFVTESMQTWAMNMEQTGQPAYLYYFTFEPAGPELGAYHAAEIVYAFNNVSLVNPAADSRHMELAEAMSDYWTNFAKTGNPNGKGLARWRPYTAGKRHYIELGDTIKPGTDLLPGIWELYQGFRTR
ncbi:MAG: carboxylesterase/lipase family protein [Pseudomonadota bacterium]